MHLYNHNNTILADNRQALLDVSASGRERPWRDKKLSNTLLSMAYDVVDPKKAERLRNCANFLQYEVNNNGIKKLRLANFCRVRLCPVCTWRRSLKVYSQCDNIINAIKKDNSNLQYIFLTLTMKNVMPLELNEAINQLHKAFNAMTRYKAFTSAIKGYYRGVEITHNIYRDNYHPHIHTILCVNKSYFTDTKIYISQAKWSELWKKALKEDYSPIVDVRKCKGDTSASIAEVAKYAVKDKDYIIADDWDMTINTVKLLDEVLANRRFVAFGGIFKEYHKKLNLDDVEEGDLLHVENEDKLTEEKQKLITYVWATGYNQYYQE